MKKGIIKIGTRGSALALAQTELVISEIKSKYPGLNIEKVIIKTKGDIEKDRPVKDFGDKSVFSTEIEEALSDGRADMAVHSAKDLPGVLNEGLCIPGVLKREDAREVLLTKAGMSYEVLKNGCPVIGTGSQRRKRQLRFFLHNAEFKEIRGNVGTRIDKLRNGEYDGIMLAAAGLKRLGLDNEKDLLYKYFSFEDIVPAGGQGIIAVEARKGDASRDRFVRKVIRDITDKETFFHFKNERKILEGAGGGCDAGFGVVSYCYIKDNEEILRIKASMQSGGNTSFMDGFNGTGHREDATRLIKMAIKQATGRCTV